MRRVKTDCRSGFDSILVASCLCALNFVPSSACAQALEAVAQLSNLSLYSLMPMATKGNVNAEEAIGLKYAYAEGVQWNLPEGIEWLRKAARGGSADAACSLGQILDNGLIFAGSLHHIATHYNESVQWYRRAAAQGWCWVELARAYEDKASSDSSASNRAAYERDMRAAANWWRKDAEPRNSYPTIYPYAKFPHGNPLAQSKMGDLYRDGRGVPQSYKCALAWYRKSASQGDGSAMMSVGYIYERGLGTPVSDELAYIFFGLAQENLDAGCHQCTNGLLGTLAKKMTPRQLMGARAIISQWQPGNSLPTPGRLARSADRGEMAIDYSLRPN